MLAAAMVSCVSEDPFVVEGEGTLRMKMSVSGAITRAEADGDADLASSCKVLISKAEKGLLYKYDGISSVPDRLVLSTGRYVAEGYAGDSVSASWDKKFYKGRREFQIQSGTDTQVELVCGIANVVAAVNGGSVDPNLIKDWKLTVGHSRAELEFTKENVADKAYFMMPSADWNTADGTDLGSLNWTITGTDGNGQAFEAVSGTVEHVKPAHQYTFNVRPGSTDVETLGGGFITVTVDESEVERSEEVMIYGAPVVVPLTDGVGLEASVTFAPGQSPYETLELGVKAYKKIEFVEVKFSDKAAFGVNYDTCDLLTMTDDVKSALDAAGFSMSEPTESKVGDDTYETRCLTMTKTMLDKLPKGEHWLKVTVRDQAGKETDKVIKFLVNDAKVMIVDQPVKLRSYSAELALEVLDESVTNIGARYREKNSSDWKTVAATNNRVSLSGLKAATTYEVQATADGYVNEVASEFTTESVFAIPNASFEEWGEDGGVIFPGTDANNKYWDTGNKGASIAGSVISNKSDEMSHSGKYSAKLTSVKAAIAGIGKLAAGNIFTGSYDRTAGTNGELTFGRPFDGSHPVSLSGYANYRPGTVDESKSAHIAKGESDQGQIYVALTSRSVQVKTADLTNYSFNPDGDYVIAYGEVTWSDNFGEDGSLKQFDIKLNYKSGRENDKPTHLIIVASSSKYGDYFEGSTGSVMYLDDLELVYE